MCNKVSDIKERGYVMRQSRRHTLLLGYIMSRLISLPFSHYIYNV